MTSIVCMPITSYRPARYSRDSPFQAHVLHLHYLNRYCWGGWEACASFRCLDQSKGESVAGGRERSGCLRIGRPVSQPPSSPHPRTHDVACPLPPLSSSHYSGLVYTPLGLIAVGFTSVLIGLISSCHACNIGSHLSSHPPFSPISSSSSCILFFLLLAASSIRQHSPFLACIWKHVLPRPRSQCLVRTPRLHPAHPATSEGRRPMYLHRPLTFPRPPTQSRIVPAATRRSYRLQMAQTAPTDRLHPEWPLNLASAPSLTRVL